MKYTAFGFSIGICFMGFIGSHIHSITYAVCLLICSYAAGEELAKDNH